MDKKINTLLLAAGFGTRLQPFTSQLPKPAIPFLNIPIGFHALSLLRNIEVNQLIVNTHHLPHKIHSLFEGSFVNQITKHIAFSNEEKEIMGSSGAFIHAKEFLQTTENFIVINADEVFFPIDENFLSDALQSHFNSESIITLLVMDHPDVGVSLGGVWVDDTDSMIGMGRDKPSQTQKGYHFIGVAIYSQEIFDWIPNSGPSDLLKDVIQPLLSKGLKVNTFPVTGQWLETGNLKDYLNSTREVLSLIAKDPVHPQLEWIFKKIFKFDRWSDFVRDHFLRDRTSTQLNGHHCKFGPNLKTEGSVVIGNNVSIGSNCSLKNCVILDHSVVPDGSHIEETMILPSKI